jgi:hypothetical protein
MSLVTKLTDGDCFVDVDKLTNSLITIDNEHREIHEGEVYRVTVSETVVSAGSLNLLLETPTGSKQIHLAIAVSSGNAADVAFYELAEASSGGTSKTPRNANRQYSDSSITTVKQDVTLNTTNAVTLIDVHVGSVGALPSSPSPGGNIETRAEWILAAGTEYCVELDNTAGVDNDMSISLSWYEHTPRR